MKKEGVKYLNIYSFSRDGNEAIVRAKSFSEGVNLFKKAIGFEPDSGHSVAGVKSNAVLIGWDHA